MSPHSLLPEKASQRLQLDVPLALDCGTSLPGVEIAFETWGVLNDAGSNAILLCHALTADQFACGIHPVTGKPGWWDHLVGPGKIIDTDRYFVICSNILGGCMGTTGPASLSPDTGAPYGLDFPVITIADMVRTQKVLVDHLGIHRLAAVIGGSMGGMQALCWATDYPAQVGAVAVIASAARHTPQNIAFHEIGRQAIMADPHWSGGAYYGHQRPIKGLAVARMTAHVTYLSEAALNRKFGRNLQDRDKIGFGFDADFQVESYLRHQGSSFVDRFDANSYLYITRAMDYFDLTAAPGLAARFMGLRAPVLVTSFTTDWLYPTTESRVLVKALHGAGVDASFVEVASANGHDAFLLEEPEFFQVLAGWLGAVT